MRGATGVPFVVLCISCSAPSCHLPIEAVCFLLSGTCFLSLQPALPAPREVCGPEHSLLCLRPEVQRTQGGGRDGGSKFRGFEEVKGWCGWVGADGEDRMRREELDRSCFLRKPTGSPRIWAQDCKNYDRWSVLSQTLYRRLWNLVAVGTDWKMFLSEVFFFFCQNDTNYKWVTFLFTSQSFFLCK